MRWYGLYYLVRQPPFSTAKLLDTDYEIDFRRVTSPADSVAVITTKPLTEEEGWTEFKRGELLMFDKGLPYRTPKCCEVVEKEGRGLFSKCVTRKCSRSPQLQEVQCGRSAESLPTISLPLAATPSRLLIAAASPRLSEREAEVVETRCTTTDHILAAVIAISVPETLSLEKPMVQLAI